MRVNGKAVQAELDPRTLLLEFLRRDLGLTGAHSGCDTSQCGACVVHVDGRSVKSCTVLAASCQDADVLTIEGISSQDGSLHPMQMAFADNHGLQCGFCTPGMIMASLELVRLLPKDELTPERIRHELHGNLCRCTGYQNIVRAVIDGARAMREKAEAANV